MGSGKVCKSHAGRSANYRDGMDVVIPSGDVLGRAAYSLMSLRGVNRAVTIVETLALRLDRRMPVL